MRTPRPAEPEASKATTKKRERSSVETKRRILEAAQAEFAAKGFDGARLGSIARAADVQQALIHHYFADKEGLHAEVVRGGLAAMTEGAWELLARVDGDAAPKGGKAKKPDLPALANAFVELLVRFFAENGAFLAILRHEARRDEGRVGALVEEVVAPVFDAVVGRLEEMRKRGDVRKDVSPAHLVLSCVAMVAFPFQEEPLVAAVWPTEVRGAAFREERKRHVVEMVLARLLP